MAEQNPHAYDDIIHLERPRSSRRRMSPLERAAQFSPFAALTGHAEALEETARQTCQMPELCADEQALLNERLQMAARFAGKEVELICTYFVPDEQKEGGAFVQKAGLLGWVDEEEHRLIFSDQTSVPMEQIVALDGRIFRQE